MSSNVKLPQSLRQSAGLCSRRAPSRHFANMRQERRPVSALALACVATGMAQPALAQTTPQPEATSGTSLPKLTVEATVKKPKAKPTSTAPAKKISPPATTATAVPEADTAATSVGAAPGGNPYADPNAPYKVDRLSGTKLTEPILDTPRTVTTVTKEVLQDTQTTTLRQLARSTPGVTLGFGEGGSVFGDNLYIRGFRANNDAYIDGVRDPGVTSRETFMTEQVEILKGPSSTIGGRGTTGGAINVVTKKPQDENFAIGSLTLGTDNTKRTTLDMNYAFDKTFAVRANGMWQDADVAGRDFVFDDRWGGAVAAEWKPTTWFKLSADYYHINLDQMSDWGVPYAGTVQGVLYNGPWPEFGVSRKNWYGIKDRDFQKGEQDIFTLTNEIKINSGTTLTTKLRKGRTFSDYIVGVPTAVNTTDPDPANWTVTATTQSNNQYNDVFAVQSDLARKFRTGWIEHSVVTGVEVSREEVDRGRYRNLDTENNVTGNIPGCSMNLWNPSATDVSSCWGVNDVAVLDPNRTYTIIDTKSLYIVDTLKLSEQLRVTAGVRLDDYDIGRSTLTTAFSRHDTMFNWNAGIVYKPLPNSSIYASVATSTNPIGQEIEGGGGDYGGLDANGELLDPEENTAYEIGTKWEFFNRNLLFTAALFQTTKENAREDVRGTAGTVTDDTGKYRVRGIEFGFAGNVTEALSVHGGAVFMSSAVLESSLAGVAGLRLANIAHTTFNLLAKYKLTETLTIGGQATYQGEISLGSLAANGRELPDAWRFDILAEYALTKSVDLQLNLNNILDEVIYDSGYRSGNPFVYIAPGRVGYATLRFKY